MFTPSCISSFSCMTTEVLSGYEFISQAAYMQYLQLSCIIPRGVESVYMYSTVSTAKAWVRCYIYFLLYHLKSLWWSQMCLTFAQITTRCNYSAFALLASKQTNHLEMCSFIAPMWNHKHLISIATKQIYWYYTLHKIN